MRWNYVFFVLLIQECFIAFPSFYATMTTCFRCCSFKQQYLCNFQNVGQKLTVF